MHAFSTYVAACASKYLFDNIFYKNTKRKNERGNRECTLVLSKVEAVTEMTTTTRFFSAARGTPDLERAAVSGTWNTGRLVCLVHYHFWVDQTHLDTIRSPISNTFLRPPHFSFLSPRDYSYLSVSECRYIQGYTQIVLISNLANVCM